MDCVSGGNLKGPLPPNDAAARALQLLQVETELCDCSHFQNNNLNMDQSTFSDFSFWKEPIADIELNLDGFYEDPKLTAVINNAPSLIKRFYEDVQSQAIPQRGSFLKHDPLNFAEIPQVEEADKMESSFTNCGEKKSMFVEEESFTETSFWRGLIEEIDSSEVGHLLGESPTKVDSQETESKSLPSKNAPSIEISKSKFIPFNYGALFPKKKNKVQKTQITNSRKTEDTFSKKCIPHLIQKSKKEEDGKVIISSKQCTSVTMKTTKYAISNRIIEDVVTKADIERIESKPIIENKVSEASIVNETIMGNMVLYANPSNETDVDHVVPKDSIKTETNMDQEIRELKIGTAKYEIVPSITGFITNTDYIASFSLVQTSLKLADTFVSLGEKVIHSIVPSTEESTIAEFVLTRARVVRKALRAIRHAGRRHARQGVVSRKTLGESNILGCLLEKFQINVILGFFGLCLTASGSNVGDPPVNSEQIKQDKLDGDYQKREDLPVSGAKMCG